MKNFVISFIVILLQLTDIQGYAQKWKTGDISVTVQENHILISYRDVLKLDIVSFSFNYTDPLSMTMEKSSKDSCILSLTYPSWVNFSRPVNEQSASIIISPVSRGIRFTGSPSWARKVSVRLADQQEHYFGVVQNLVPDNRKSPDLRGKTVDVMVEGEQTGYSENFSSVWSAFYFSNKGYASFFDTYSQGKYQFAVNGMTNLTHKTGNLNWYVFFGSENDSILNAYYQVIGKPKFLPLWACGTTVWRDENKGGSEEILSDIQKFTELKIPLTAWMVDRPYSDGSNGWSEMNFNEKLFPRPEQWIKKLNHTYHVKFLTWVGPMTFKDKEFPGLIGGTMNYMDLTNPAAVDEFEKRLKTRQYVYGVQGHKMDRADEYLPVYHTWYDGTNNLNYDQNNKYVYLYARVIDKILSDTWGSDHFNYARAAYQRCQPYLSALWGGDSRSCFEGLKGNIANSMRCSFMGFPVWGSDVGGYLGEGRIDEGLYIRWLQFGAWSGFFEVKIDGAGGRGEDRPPWKYSAILQQVFRNLCEQRRALIPYIYSLSATSSVNGPLMKPLAYVYRNDSVTWPIWDEYMFGNAFLVAPVTDTLNYRNVYLPEGRWRDYYNHTKEFKGNTTIRYSAPMDKIPVFIKENTIYVTGNIYAGSTLNWDPDYDKKQEYIIHVIPGNSGDSCRFMLIDFPGDNQEVLIKAGTSGKKTEIQIDPLAINAKVRLLTARKPSIVVVNGKLTPFNYNSDNQTIDVNIAKNNKVVLVVE